MNKTQINTIVIDTKNLPLQQIIDISRGRAKISISNNPDFISRIEGSREVLLNALKKGTPVYGVNTGYGKSCGKRISMETALKNGQNLIRFHGCGTGDPIGIPETRAAILTRILCFAKGYSGVSIDLLGQMAGFINHGITPVVPCEGSVGASGDLTPMSYVAAALMGERDVFYDNKRMPAMQALEKAGLKPYTFGPKEPLAIMNGTSVMTGIAAMAIERSKSILEAAISATAMSIHALMGNAHHYHPLISRIKPHPGQDYIAAKISELLKTESDSSVLEANTLETLQDPYSLRCSPQILGVLHDALRWIMQWVEIEANSSNDNPIADPDSGEILMGGNFYGGHIALAMDTLKASLASVADMSDRQIALMVDPHVNRGLPADLVRIDNSNSLFNHGFKAVSIASSSLTAEALKATMPAASFSRSTESHNQDKVSMGTISSRDTHRICQLTERVVAMHMLAAVQACEIRNNYSVRPGIERTIEKVRSVTEPLHEDRPLDSDIDALSQAISESLFDS